MTSPTRTLLLELRHPGRLGQVDVTELREGEEGFEEVMHGMGWVRAHDAIEPGLMPSPSPKTVEALHEALEWLARHGYSPDHNGDRPPVAELCIAGKTWHVDRNWFIGTHSPSDRAGDVAVDCRAVRAELEKQAKYASEAKPLAVGDVVAGRYVIEEELSGKTNGHPVKVGETAAGEPVYSASVGPVGKLPSERVEEMVEEKMLLLLGGRAYSPEADSIRAVHRGALIVECVLDYLDERLGTE